MATRPETFRITHVSHNGIGVVVSSNASFLVPFAKKYKEWRREKARSIGRQATQKRSKQGIEKVVASSTTVVNGSGDGSGDGSGLGVIIGVVIGVDWARIRSGLRINRE